MTVLLAPDKFKGSLTAPEVAEALATGVRCAFPDESVRSNPVADGGDGTVQAALASGFRSVPVQVRGPVGEPVRTEIAIAGATAVVELAAASGLALLDEPAPLAASSYGTGEAVRAALDAGARTIVLGVGGSACTDGGKGMLEALGARVIDAKGADPGPGGGALACATAVDLSTLDSRLSGAEVVLASDVSNPLIGDTGAARVYGPQKGAGVAQVAALDAALQHWADLLCAAGGRAVAEQPGAGAAGGVGFAALSALRARMRPGVDVVLELVDFTTALDGARLVVTGEGSLDEQTLQGKGPAGVAQWARVAGVPVVAVAGACALSRQRLHEAGFNGVYTLREIESDARRCHAEAAELLRVVGQRLARDWSGR